MKKIILEEINEVTLYDQRTGESFELTAKTSPYVIQQLGTPPSKTVVEPDEEEEITVVDPEREEIASPERRASLLIKMLKKGSK